MEVGLVFLETYGYLGCAWGAWRVNKVLHTSGTRLLSVAILGYRMASIFKRGGGGVFFGCRGARTLEGTPNDHMFLTKAVLTSYTTPQSKVMQTFSQKNLHPPGITTGSSFKGHQKCC